MKLHSLKKITQKPSRRLGQGYGSARAKTSGRGTKGQKARTKIKLNFEGGALSITKRLPMLKGKGRNKSIKKRPAILSLSQLNSLPSKTIVDADSLVKHGVISNDLVKKSAGFKILANGNIEKVLTVKLPVTKGARAKIESAGGSVA